MPDTDDRTGLISLPLTHYLQRLASAESAPGGGSAAALAGALAAALVGMVAGVTIGKAHYAAVHDEMASLAQQARVQQDRLTRLVDADAEAYSAVTQAYRLPKNSEDEQARRRTAIRLALREASVTPLETAIACASVLELAATAAVLGNRNATSDALAAVWLAHSALRTATRNAEVNLAGIHDDAYERNVRNQLAQLRAMTLAPLARAEAVAGQGA